MRHLPVCHVTLTGRPIDQGSAHDDPRVLRPPGHGRSRTGRWRVAIWRGLRRSASNGIDTRLVIVDDLHFLEHAHPDVVEVANQLKWLANEYNDVPFAGVALRRGFPSGKATRGRTRRWRRHSDGGPSSAWTLLAACNAHTRTEWGRLLWHLEQSLVLADARDGMLVDLSRYLFARTTGNIGSLMDLIRRGASRAIRTGRSVLTGSCSTTSVSTRVPRQTERGELEAKHRQQERTSETDAARGTWTSPTSPICRMSPNGQPREGRDRSRRRGSGSPVPCPPPAG